MTDEDKLIERLEVHKKLIGWMIAEFRKEGIEAQRTTGNSPKGDILILNKEDAQRVKEILRNIHSKFKG